MRRHLGVENDRVEVAGTVAGRVVARLDAKQAGSDQGADFGGLGRADRSPSFPNSGQGSDTPDFGDPRARLWRPTRERRARRAGRCGCYWHTGKPGRQNGISSSNGRLPAAGLSPAGRRWGARRCLAGGVRDGRSAAPSFRPSCAAGAAHERRADAARRPASGRGPAPRATPTSSVGSAASKSSSGEPKACRRQRPVAFPVFCRGGRAIAADAGRLCVASDRPSQQIR